LGSLRHWLRAYWGDQSFGQDLLPHRTVMDERRAVCLSGRLARYLRMLRSRRGAEGPHCSEEALRFRAYKGGGVQPTAVRLRRCSGRWMGKDLRTRRHVPRIVDACGPMAAWRRSHPLSDAGLSAIAVTSMRSTAGAQHDRSPAATLSLPIRWMWTMLLLAGSSLRLTGERWHLRRGKRLILMNGTSIRCSMWARRFLSTVAGGSRARAHLRKEAAEGAAQMARPGRQNC